MLCIKHYFYLSSSPVWVLVKYGCLSYILILLTACASMPLKITVIASSHLNTDNRHRSLPVMLKFYQLSQADEFEQASFRQLWQQERINLANTLLKKEEYYLSPKQRLETNLSLKQDARFIGIMAIFRHPQAGQWRVLQELPGGFWNFPKKIKVFASDNSLHLQSA